MVLKNRTGKFILLLALALGPTITWAGQIQGYKIDTNGAIFSNSQAILNVAGTATTSNPYYKSLSGNAYYRVTSASPVGYRVYYSICTNCTSHSSSSWVTGNSVSVYVPSSGYVDLWWKYVAVSCSAPKPSGWPSFTPWKYNPVLVASKSYSTEGNDNVYAPHIEFTGGQYVMWYGAQGKDYGDQIFMTWSSDGKEWRKYSNDDTPYPALPRGNSVHVNDPSVVLVNGNWMMFYTAASPNDRIALASSLASSWRALSVFTNYGTIVSVGPVGSWEETIVGRPSVLYENGVYKMWYDGSSTTTNTRHVGYAYSYDGKTWTKYTGNPVFFNAGAVDVKKVNGVYVMLRESGDGTYWATSSNGTCWSDQGKLFGLSGKDYDRYGQVTPFLQLQNGVPIAVWFGGASVSTWDKNRIAVAYANNFAIPSGGGCTACTTAGNSCDRQCQKSKVGNAGYCAIPGSTDIGACCGCYNDGCQACVGSAADCQEACVKGGHSGGWCGVPGSTDPGHCCVCF